MTRNWYDSQRTGKPTIPVRLIKIKLPSSEIAVFATNLLNKRLNRRRSLGALYGHRWALETAFREMKVWYVLENFAARYAEGIHQELAALMIFMQLTANLEAQAFDYHDIETKKKQTEGSHPTIPNIRFNRRNLCVCVGYLMAAFADGPENLMKCMIMQCRNYGIIVRRENQDEPLKELRNHQIRN